MLDPPSHVAGPRRASGCAATSDLYLAIASAADSVVEATRHRGLLLSLHLDPSLRGLRAARADDVVSALRCIISAASHISRSGAVVVYARARNDEVEIAVHTRVDAFNIADPTALQAASKAARVVGASLEVGTAGDSIVWSLKIFAPPARVAALIVEPNAYFRIELSAVLGELGFPVEVAGDERDLASRLARRAFGIVGISLDVGESEARGMCQLALSARWPAAVFGINLTGARFARFSLHKAGFSGLIARPLAKEQVGVLLSAAGVSTML